MSNKKLLDSAFFLFVFSSIIMATSPIGKVFQLFFVLFSFVLYIKKKKNIPYFFLALTFVIYVWGQVVFDIAYIKDSTRNMAATMLYTTMFLLGFCNYVIYRNDTYKIAEIYAKSTALAFIFVILLYYNTLFNLRLNASQTVYVMGLGFGGSSSTAIAMQASIPAFFITLFPMKGQQRTFLYVLFFFIIAMLTGTRKVLLIFVYIFFCNRFLLNNQDRHGNVFKYILLFGVGIIIGYFLLFKIPLFYSIVGTRLENALIFIKSGESDEGSIVVRSRMIETALYIFQKNPIYGCGMDFFKGSLQSELGYYSHNNFLELLSGGGIVGFVIYYSKYILLLIQEIVRVRITSNEKDKSIWESCIGFLVIMTILEYWQVTYFYRYIVIYQAFMLGMLYKTDKNINDNYEFRNN